MIGALRSVIRHPLSAKADRTLGILAWLVLLLMEIACAGARSSRPPATAISLDLLRFQDGRPGGGPGQLSAPAFMDALESALARGGFQVRVVGDASEAGAGLALKGTIDELPKVYSTPKKGRVSFLAAVMVDEREVFSRVYSAEAYPHQGQDVGDQDLKRALTFAFADLIRDLKTASRNTAPPAPAKP